MTEVLGDNKTHFLPEILEEIFRYLNGRSLSRAATVNKSWNEVATRELRNRGPQRILMSSLKSNVCDSVRTIPQVTLLFVGSATVTSNTFAINKKNIHLDILSKYKYQFPHHLVAVKVYILMMDEEVINYNDQSQSDFLSLLIPQYRDLDVRVANSQFFSGDKTEFMNSLLPEDSYAKATIILFTQGPNVNFSILELIQQSMKKRQQKYSLWGIAACSAPFTAENDQKDEVTYQELQDKSDRIFAMSITGSSLESSSIVINCINKNDEFDRKLMDFRDQIRFKRHSIGLVCGPCDVLNMLGIEGLNLSNMYGDYKQLMSAVKKVFPGVPFIGMYDATFACYYGSETKTTESFYENVQNSMSLSLMVLTFD